MGHKHSRDHEKEAWSTRKRGQWAQWKGSVVNKEARSTSTVDILKWKCIQPYNKTWDKDETSTMNTNLWAMHEWKAWQEQTEKKFKGNIIRNGHVSKRHLRPKEHSRPKEQSVWTFEENSDHMNSFYDWSTHDDDRILSSCIQRLEWPMQEINTMMRRASQSRITKGRHWAW